MAYNHSPGHVAVARRTGPGGPVLLSTTPPVSFCPPLLSPATPARRGWRPGSAGSYVWGLSTQLRPGGERLYLVELLPGAGKFDLSDRSASALRVYARVDGQWVNRGVFPSNGRPIITGVQGLDGRGVGSFTNFNELTTTDRDGDGLVEVRVGSAWVGWSTSKGLFVTKP